MRWIIALLVTLSLAGCVVPTDQPADRATQAMESVQYLAPEQAAHNFIMAVDAVEPVAEQYCRAHTRGQSCNFNIVIDDRPDRTPNAFQSLDRNNRPILAFNLALIANARNVDEIAFVIGHEAAHHIAGHIPQQQQSATQGALVAGMLAAISGAGDADIQQAQKVGFTIGARRFSKDFELEADSLGAEITERAGFDALSGAKFFDRLPDPGNKFLGTHPPNAARRAAVAQAVARLR